MPEINRTTLQEFPERLYEKMQRINPGIQDMELYEFCSGLHDLLPGGDWASVDLDETAQIEQMVNDRAFYDSIQVRPRLNGRLALDSQVRRLTGMLFVGLVAEKYPQEWVRQHFYFDIRSFLFLHRTRYFTPQVLAHFGGSSYQCFKPKQDRLERCQDIGYPEFMAANAEVDRLFIDSAQKLVTAKGTPILLAIAGPTAAGKTEIVERLRFVFEQAGQRVASIEMDNFLTDRDYREAQGIHSLGKAAIHFELFTQSLADITHGRKISIPRYDFVYATSSHDLDGRLKPGGQPVEILPADIIFIEGNFPFLYEEAAHIIDIKVVYLTDDDVRLKRKWRRDIDYRKKYEPNYLRNRFFKEQFTMAETCFLPQMALCDILVHTSGAALWLTPETIRTLTSI
jgi:uridine kinase